MRLAAEKGRAFSQVAVLLTALVLALSLAVPCAFADEGEGEGAGDNRVDPGQRPDTSFIYDSTIADLAQADSTYDGQTVQVSGEVVGDCIVDEGNTDNRWITMVEQSDPNASISVLMSAEAAARIDTYGRYGVTGTVVQVRGTFNLACHEHEGLSDLHATTVTVQKKGVEHTDSFVPENFLVGAVLVLIGFGMMVLFRHLRERQR